MKAKHYHNGVEHIGEHHKEARDALAGKGIYKTLHNFGPYLTSKKEDKYNRKVDGYTLEGYEFTIIEYEYMAFDLGSLKMSKPIKGIQAWYQPVKG